MDLEERKKLIKETYRQERLHLWIIYILIAIAGVAAVACLNLHRQVYLTIGVLIGGIETLLYQRIRELKTLEGSSNV